MILGIRSETSKAEIAGISNLSQCHKVTHKKNVGKHKAVIGLVGDTTEIAPLEIQDLSPLDSNHLLNETNSYSVGIHINTGKIARFKKLLLQSQPLLNRVFHFIEAHYQHSISLREVAEAVDRSPAYLTDLVRRETGKTVLSWIIERRMTEACRLLLETDQSVEQIAEAVGYLDRRHFSRQFLRSHKMTPQAWRRTRKSKSLPLLEIDPQNAKSRKSIKQKATTVTVAEAQRLEVCLQEIAVILNNKMSAGEVLTLEGIEKSSVGKTGDGSIQITLEGV
jgi:AraC-like DNA-binding protein